MLEQSFLSELFPKTMAVAAGRFSFHPSEQTITRALCPGTRCPDDGPPKVVRSKMASDGREWVRDSYVRLKGRDIFTR